MPYAQWLPDVLRDAGLIVRPYDGWETRGGSSFSPRGVMLHHTVTSPNSSDWLVDRMLAETGSSKVPPPLANWSTNRDGSISVIAAGTTNHGGQGSWKGISGNRFWFGDEMKNLGTSAEPWPARQLASAYQAAAAVLTHIGADASWLCGHKEYATPPGRKVDPHSLNMNMVRNTVHALMQKEEAPVSLPINAQSHKEEIRHVQDMLGVSASGSWDFVDRVKELAVRANTGDPNGLNGVHINGRMYTQLLEEFIQRHSGGGGGDHNHDGEYVRDVIVSR